MLKINNYGKLKKSSKIEQSYLYTANKIFDISKSKKINVVGISSSFTDKKSVDIICRNICKRICKKEIKTCLISANIDLSSNKCSLDETLDGNLKIIKSQNISSENLEKLISEEKSSSFVVINLAPVNIFAQALEHAKICKNIILVEKYCYSKYKDFENTIDILKLNGVDILGIIAHV